MASETIGVKLKVEGAEEFKRELKNVNAYIKELTAELKEVDSRYDTGGMDNYREKVKLINESIDAHRKKIELLNQELKEASSKYGDNSSQVYNLKAKIADAEREVNNLEKALDGANNELDDLDGNADKAGKSFSDMFKTMVGADISSATVIGIVKKVAGAVKDLAKDIADTSIAWESAFTGVKKTVDGTDEQMGQLEKDLLGLAGTMPESSTQIAAVAEAAGQLGIGIDDIVDFTKVMVMLGDSTNLSSEEAASALAKFANVTKMSNKDYDKLGSTIVDLGNNFATTEADIVEMGTRIAATGEVVGLTEPEIMALATALSSVGIEAEAGGSAISKMLKKIETLSKTYGTAKQTLEEMYKAEVPQDGSGESFEEYLRDLELLSSNYSGVFKEFADSYGLTNQELSGYVKTVQDVDKYSQIAGKSTEEFLKQWEENPLTGLDDFITGLGKLDEDGGSAIETMKELGLTEVRLSNAVLALSTSGGILSEAVETANKAWEDNVALTEEAEKRYETMESKLETLSNKADTLKIKLGDMFEPTATNFVDSTMTWLDDINAMMDRFNETDMTGLEKLRDFNETVVFGKDSTVFDVWDNVKEDASATAGFVKDILEAPFHVGEMLDNLWAKDVAFINGEDIENAKQDVEDLGESIKKIVDLGGVKIDINADTTHLSEIRGEAETLVTALDAITGEPVVIKVNNTELEEAIKKADELKAKLNDTNPDSFLAGYDEDTYGMDVNTFTGSTAPKTTRAFKEIQEASEDTKASVEEVNTAIDGINSSAQETDSNFGAISDSMSNMFENINFEYFVENWESVKAVFEEAGETMKNMIPTEIDVSPISNAINDVTTGLSAIESGSATAQASLQTLFDAFNKAPGEGEGKAIGLNFAMGIAQGLASGTGAVVAGVERLVQSMVSASKNKLEIHSPSRVAHDEIGVMFARGIGDGFNDEMPTVFAKIQNSLNHDFTRVIRGAVQGITGGASSLENVLGNMGLDVTVPLAIDGQKIATATSRVEYRKVNNARRAVGI